MDVDTEAAEMELAAHIIPDDGSEVFLGAIGDYAVCPHNKQLTISKIVDVHDEDVTLQPCVVQSGTKQLTVVVMETAQSDQQNKGKILHLLTPSKESNGIAVFALPSTWLNVQSAPDNADNTASPNQPS